MAKQSTYVSKQPDEAGYVAYTEEEHKTWEVLYKRQIDVIKDRACPEFINGLDILKLESNAIPQLPDINRKLKECTGWGVEAVPALIGFEEFFQLLANKKFPVATFIRTPEDLDYLQEPDIFHEIFGHCPLLTNPSYAAFSQRYGELGLKATKEERVMLARLYWFTIEFGLVNTDEGLRIYGGGILSSKEETIYALESDQPVRTEFNVMDIFRTPYRIDVLQRIYFKINALSQLDDMLEMDLLEMVREARKLGMFESLYPPKDKVA